jgi:uncharacterized delta-60 repeat protein
MTSNLQKRQGIMLATALVASMAFSQAPFELDGSFQTAIRSEYVSSMMVMGDGGLLLSGQINFTESPLSNNLGSARLFTDGSRDEAFPLWPITAGGWKLARWGDQYYVGNGQEIRRLYSNGYTDNSFGPMSACPYFSSLQAGDYHVFPDGRVVFTGTHLLNDTALDFVGPYRLVWLTSQGCLDTTRVHRQANGVITLIKEELNGRFLCSGSMNSYEGSPVSVVFRIEADGSLDPGYSSPIQGIPTDIGSSFRNVLDAEPLADGRSLVSGFWRLAGSTDTIGVMRLMPDGSQDPSFSPVPLSNAETPSTWDFPAVNDILPLGDGRFVIVGDFDRVHGQERHCIAMLNADGSLSDDYFTGPGCGIYNHQPLGPGGPVYPQRWVSGIVPAPDGSYYIHGSYMAYDDGSNNYPQQGFVSRLHGFNVGVAERERIPFTLYPNPVSTQLTVHLEKLPQQGELVLRDALGRVALRERVTTYQQTLGLHGLGSGVYLLELWSKGQRVGCDRVVVE